MDFFIKKNATLPVLKLQVVKDGRSDYDNFMKTIELSSIFFSMVDADTGIPKISSKPAGFVEKTFIDPNAEPEYYIYYQLTPKDTNRVGKYEGQFMLRNDDGVLILPIREKLHIYVQESFIADDLAYESCYVSEFPCCVNGPYTTQTTTTPCPSCGPNPSPNPSPTPTSTPPSPTPTPLPTPMLDTCTILFNNHTKVYAYNLSANTTTLLGNTFQVSPNIAHTTTKMWLYNTNFISEYNITLSPWSVTFNRGISLPINFYIGPGLGAVSNTQVITTTSTAPSQIVILDLTTSPSVSTVIGELKPNRLVTGDILLTTTNKILLTNFDATGSTDGYLSQYSYPSGDFEIEVKLNPTITSAYGLFVDDGKLYIAGGQTDGPIYRVNLDYPYELTYVSNAGVLISGASQPPICNNVNLNLPELTDPVLIDSNTYLSVGTNQYLTF